ncbi:MAG TPA: hypothetical protein VN175_00255 [Rhizomicrobium sp.]|nr:hypothetical protein [Rhizomicrobium sp.]
MNWKKLALAAAAVSAMSIGTMMALTGPAAARVVCDWDGDDCWQTRPRYWDRDWEERREWRERREWEERREREAYRRWYWRQQPRYYDYYPGGGSVWFNF